MLSIATLLLALFSQAALGEEYHIVPVNSTFLCQHHPNGTCFTLDTFPSLVNYKKKTNITLSFYPGEHLLTQSLSFHDLKSITLTSEQQSNISQPRIRCNKHKGFYINNTDLFVMQGLLIHRCVAKYSVIQIILVKTFFVQDCKLEAICSHESAISFKSSRGYITNTAFVSNQANSIKSGAAIRMSKSTVNITLSNFDKNYGKNGGAISMSYSTVNIIKSYFCQNQATNDGGALSIFGSTVKIINSNFDKNNASSGGALNVMFHSTESDVNIVNIVNSTFVENQANNDGGAVTTNNYKVKISNSTFDKNYASGNGGAIAMSTSTVTISNSNFSYNRAHENGGVATIQSKTKVSITNSNFDSNQAGCDGGAIYSSSKGTIITFDQSSSSKITRNEANFGGGLNIHKNSEFYVHGDVLIADNIAYESGGGIFGSEGMISFHGKDITTKCKKNDVRILNNKALKDGGGMYIKSIDVRIQYSNLTVSGNHADNFGGGFYFSNAYSRLLIASFFQNRNYFLYFKSNSAQRGGGVYVSDEKCTKRMPCFMSNDFMQSHLEHECNNRTTKHMHFENNSAVVRGSDIYGGLLEKCKVENNCPEYNGMMYMKQNVSWTWGSEHHDTIENTTDFKNHISSDPVKVCFCVDNVIDCTLKNVSILRKKKGETFTLSLVVADQVGMPLNASLRGSLNLDGGRGRLKVEQQFRPLPDKCTEVEFNVYCDQNNTRLQLDTDGLCRNAEISKKEVQIVFDPCTCPPGFEQKHDPINCICDCTEALKPYIKHCWQKEGTFQLNDHNWIQNNNNTGFVIHNCPFDFCVKKPINISLSEFSDKQCAFNRTGIICGKCDQGLSMVFASSQCQQCSDFYLFLLLPFGLAGIALVAFILLLNMTVATGTIHGLIFYANILAANRSVFIPAFGNNANILTVFVSWLNLDLGIDTCFYNGMDSYGKLMLQLVFPAYLFFLIITIIVLCDRSQRIARLFGKRNPEATLYTLFLLSYSKLIRTIITALQFAILNYRDGSKEIVWLYDANVRYFALNHIPRLLAAFIITILGAVYTSLLLFGQLFNKCSEYRIMKWTSHKYYIHFMKAHHAPLSDNHRYWVGLQLLARLTHYLISAFTNDKFIVVLSVLVITLLILIHKTVFKSFFKMSLNLLETMFILNLSVLSGATLFIQISGGDQQALAIVSMSISFIAFLGIVFYHILDSCGIKLKNALTKILPTFRRRRDIDYRPLAIIESEDENTEDESDEELIDLSNIPEDNATNEPYDPTRYITPPVIRSAVRNDQLREPALDDLCPLTSADYNLHPRIPPTKPRQAPTVTELVVLN